MDKNKNKKKSSLGKLLSNTFKGMFFGNNKVEMSILEEEQMQSPFRTIVRNFFENKIATTGLIAFSLVFIACFTLAAVFPLDEAFQDTTQQNISPGYNIMSMPKALNGNVKDISVGSTYGVGVDNNNKMYIWGNPPDNLKAVIKANPIEQYKVKSVSAGLNHILAITEEGKVITWAPNRFKLDTIPTLLASEKNIKEVRAGYQFSFAVTEEGMMYVWGNMAFLGSLTQNTIPEDIQGNVDRVELSTDNVIILLKDGSVRVLGSETPAQKNVPELTNVVDIAATDNVMVAIDADGKVHAWGNPMYNLMNVPEDLPAIVSVSGGRSHFIVLDAEGKAYGWGRNNYNQITIPSTVENGKTALSKVYSGYFQNYGVDANGNVTKWGLKGYLMGSDGFGRDVFKRLAAGGRLTLTVGAVAVIIQVILGVIVGGFAGFYGGQVDNILMRFAEIVGSIPFIPLAMTLSVVVGNKLNETQRIIMIMMILGILGWSGLARLVRAQILAEREKEFVLAAKATGIIERVIIFRHIIPNVITVVIVNATLSYAGSLLTESGLSYLGFGVLEPKPTWGNMLTGSQSSNVIANYWWRWVFPALFLSICTISINMIGDGLRDAIDPKSNER